MPVVKTVFKMSTPVIVQASLSKALKPGVSAVPKAADARTANLGFHFRERGNGGGIRFVGGTACARGFFGIGRGFCLGHRDTAARFGVRDVPAFFSALSQVVFQREQAEEATLDAGGDEDEVVGAADRGDGREAGICVVRGAGGEFREVTAVAKEDLDQLKEGREVLRDGFGRHGLAGAILGWVGRVRPG